MDRDFPIFQIGFLKKNNGINKNKTRFDHDSVKNQ